MNTRCLLPAALALLFASATTSTGGATDAPATFHWVDKGESIELVYGTRPVIEYMCAPYDDSTAERRDATYKVYHHVFSPDGGVRLTKGDTGGLYPHHRGLFYGFKDVTYHGGKHCDIWHCKDGAYQSHAGVINQFADAESAGQTVAIDWHGRGGELFAREQRTVVVRMSEPSPGPSLGGRGNVVEPSPGPSLGGRGNVVEPSPGPSLGGRGNVVEPSPSPTLQGRGNGAGPPTAIQIDWSSHLETADGQPIHLDGDPQHAGFHFRAAQEVADKTSAQTYYVRTDGRGKLGETRNWEPVGAGRSEDASGGEAGSERARMNRECTNRPWDAMCIVLGGRRYTILYLDHPDNPRPARYSERDYGRFGSYFVTDVTAQRPLDVRYRIWVQPGEMTVDQCAAKYREFVAH